MFEGIVVLVGLCMTFVPIIIYFKYLLTHIKNKTRFDYHIELVKDKKGRLGVYLAYSERILFGIVIANLGILMSELFGNESLFMSFVILLIFYVIVKYFDEKNEK